MDGAGREHALWIDDDQSQAFYAMRQPGQTWSGAARLDPGIDPGTIAVPALATGPGGSLYAAWSEMYQDRWQIRFAVKAGDSAEWIPAQAISPGTAGSAWAPAIAVDGQGRAYVLWQSNYKCGGAGSLSDIYLAIRDEDGRWQPLEKLDPNPTGGLVSKLRLVVDGAGDLYAEWKDLGPEGALTYADFRAQDGTWSGKWKVAP